MRLSERCAQAEHQVKELKQRLVEASDAKIKAAAVIENLRSDKAWLWNEGEKWCAQVGELKKENRELKSEEARAWHRSTGETFKTIGRDGKPYYNYTFRPKGDSCLNTARAPLWRILLFKIGIVRVLWFSDYYENSSSS